jgi:flagellar basal-body rod protein FlgC
VFEAVRTTLGGDRSGAAVRVRGITESEAPALARYEPGNPLANEEGYVFAPNVNVVEQMVDMISASRSYQSNVEVMNAAKEMLLSTLRLGQG